ncbi:hypothetical protein ABVT39_019188 [Epinephelus coioides]
MELLECYYTSNPNERSFVQRMWDIWMLRNPTSRITKKPVLAQCSNIHKRQLLSQLEIDEVQQTCYSKGEPGRQVKVGMSSSSSQIGYQALTSPYDTDSLTARANDLRLKIMDKLEAQQS